MSEHTTESFGSHQDEDAYEWDYDDRREPNPRILWGRIAALLLVVVVVFLVGRATAGGEDARIERLRAEVAELEAENERLQAELDAARAFEPTGTPTPAPPADEEAAGEEQTYTVRSGDTLRGIAQNFYGDPDLDDCIAAANQITEPTQLTVGQELTIPDETDC